ncbi:MAG: hypothetical protein WC544_02270 [Patescibacteria group bacterium]
MTEPQSVLPHKPIFPWLKLAGYGLQLFVLTMLLLFIMSVVTGSDQPVDYWWTGIIVAVLLAGCSWLYSRRLKPPTRKVALAYGMVWAVMLALILMIIAVPNQTAPIVFGQWSTYLIFIGVAAGPSLTKYNNPVSH